MLEGSEKTLGKDHPNTIDVVFCLAGLYHKQGKLEDAVVMYQRAMTSMTMTLGDSIHDCPLPHLCSGRYEDPTSFTAHIIYYPCGTLLISHHYYDSLRRRTHIHKRQITVSLLPSPPLPSITTLTVLLLSLTLLSTRLL